jgi:predicted MPP superfamily phosphohydrolase
VDDAMPQDMAKEFLSTISERYPCYYVSGNHEYESREIDKIKELIEGYGITVLEGDCAAVMVNGQKLNICGIDDPSVGFDVFLDQLQSVGASVDGETFSLLLTHRPEYINQYLNYDFDLILAGHTHGGQWRIPGILNGLYAPNQGWFPPYAGGQYAFEHTDLIVSRGLAKESTRIPRIFNRPELVMITIQP